tara:strand:- start:230 stop:481 length:252 start_codon:yes stop_codon:yes gene_type:complete
LKHQLTGEERAGQYVGWRRGLGSSALEAYIQTNGGNNNYCYLSIPLDYGKVEGSHYTATCSHNNGTFNDMDFTARFYFDRVEE